jgi:MFS family permease
MSALRDARFRRLAAGQALSSFGDSALYLVLAIWVKDLTGSNGAAGAVFFALGAMSLLAPAGGVLVDRVRHRRRLLMTADAMTAGVVCLLLLVHSRNDLWLIYAVAAAYGLSCTIVGPASSALLKDLLADADLGSANAIRQTANRGLRLVSPLVGAGLYAGFGGGWLAVFDAATFLASIAAVVSVRLVESPPAPREERPSLRSEVSAGFAHIRATPLLRRISITAGTAMLGLGLFESIDFAVVADLGHPPSFFGVLVSVQGGGSILGGLVVATAMRRLGEGTVVALAFVAFAVSAVGLIVHSLAVVLASVVLLGMAVSWFAVGVGTAMQRLTPSRLQGRVSAAGYVVTDIPQTVSIACGAVLISVVDFRTLLGVLAGVTSACGVGLLVVLATDSPRTVAPVLAETAV